MPRRIPARAYDRRWRMRTDASGVSVKPDGRLEGYVRTPHGFVEVFSAPKMFARIEAGLYLGPTTRLRFLKSGFEHTRSYTSMLTRRGAAIVAARFAREIAGKR